MGYQPVDMGHRLALALGAFFQRAAIGTWRECRKGEKSQILFNGRRPSRRGETTVRLPLAAR